GAFVFLRVRCGLIPQRRRGSGLISFLTILLGLRAMSDVRPDTALIGPVTRIPHMTRAVREEIRVQRHDDIGVLEMVDRLDGAAERKLRTARNRITGGRLPDVPFRSWEIFLYGLKEIRHRRRIDRLGKNP